MIKRELYMKRIRPFIGNELVKVLTGIRRSGKSVMLDLIKEELLASGIDGGQFISLNFENMSNAHLCTAVALHDEIIPSAISNNVTVPSYDYFQMMDQKVLEAALEASDFTSATITIDQINPFNLPDVTGNEPGVTVNKDSILRNYGYLKFYGEDGNLYTNWNKWNNEIATVIGAANVPSQDFINIYQNNMAYVINNARGCAATVTGNYGHYGQQNNWSVSIEGKDWGFAWSKGFLEGLIVYPVSWLIDNIALGIDPALSGLGQILSIVIVTIIVRLVVMGLTLKSTMDQQKTQAIQPQLAKLQAKYPNSNTSQAEKTRLAQEQMTLYKRNHISPFSMILVAIVQFPVFIAVWGALSGNAILTSGELLNMPLSTPLSSILFNFSGQWYLNSTGFWTALVLFILMAVGQWVAMMLPQWINKRRIKKAARSCSDGKGRARKNEEKEKGAFADMASGRYSRNRRHYSESGCRQPL